MLVRSFRGSNDWDETNDEEETVMLSIDEIKDCFEMLDSGNDISFNGFPVAQRTEEDEVILKTLVNACLQIQDGSNVGMYKDDPTPKELKYNFNNVWHLEKFEGFTWDRWVLSFEGHEVFAMQERMDDYYVSLCEFDCDRQVLGLFLKYAVDHKKRFG